MFHRNSSVSLCENETGDREEKIVSYLETKKEVGATFPELQVYLSLYVCGLQSTFFLMAQYGEI